MTDSSINPPDVPATREEELRERYRAIVGAQTVPRRGETVPLDYLRPDLESPERRRRERAWRLESGRRLEDGPALSELWRSLVTIRSERVSRERTRRHPTASDAAHRAHLAVEEFVTSVLVRLHERRRRQLGLRTIRPWDLFTLPSGFPTDPLFASKRDVIQAVTRALASVQYQAGAELETPHIPSSLLESDEGTEEVLIHFGEAVARDTTSNLFKCRAAGNDVARLALPLLVLHGTGVAKEGARTSAPLRRVRIRHLERRLLNWTFGAMIDAFEESMYSRPDQATNEDEIGAIWSSLWLRFLPAVDWAGLEDLLTFEWQWHDALFLSPGESMIRISHEVEVFKSWSQATDRRIWFEDLGTGERTEDHGLPDTAIIVDQDLLDVARWMEDVIEELEGGK